MARPNWEYVRVDVLLPDHPKLDSLSYAAKWTLIELWCWCGKNTTDGFVRDAKWKTFGPPSARASLVKAGLATRGTGGYLMHDYLDHQRSLDEIKEVKAKRSEAGKRSAEARARAKALVQHGVEQNVEQTRSKPATEAEAEAEAELKSAGVVDQSSRRSGDPPGLIDDEIDLVIHEIQQATGRAVPRGWAADVRSGLLAGREVTNPAAYLQAAIRGERDPAARFLPVAAEHPSARPVAEAVMAAGLTPNGTPLRGADVAAIAAEARRALTTRQDPST